MTGKEIPGTLFCDPRQFLEPKGRLLCSTSFDKNELFCPLHTVLELEVVNKGLVAYLEQMKASSLGLRS